MVKFKDFSRPLSVFQVLFKVNFIFKDFSRQSCIFKYFSSLCEPWYTSKFIYSVYQEFECVHIVLLTIFNRLQYKLDSHKSVIFCSMYSVGK